MAKWPFVARLFRVQVRNFTLTSAELKLGVKEFFGTKDSVHAPVVNLLGQTRRAPSESGGRKIIIFEY